MNAIEIRGLSKTFRGIHAIDDLNLTVPNGSIYGLIGENGSGKSTTEKLICGLLIAQEGTINLYGRPHTDAAVRSSMGVLIENPGCFPNSTVYSNLMMQALNLGVENPKEEVTRVLKLVRMVGASERKFKQCSLGMKQRLGVAQALLGRPHLLILDEPINGLDADGMRIVRETLIRLNREEGVTILISSHILGELSKVATHYGIIREGKLIREVPASAMSEECRDYVLVNTGDNLKAKHILSKMYRDIDEPERGIRIFDETDSSRVSGILYEHDVAVYEIGLHKVGLEEYYLSAMENDSKGIYHG